MEKAGACRGLRLTLQQGMAEDEKLLLAGAALFRQGRQGRVKAGGGLRVQLHGRAFPVDPAVPGLAPGVSSFTSSEAGYSPPSRQTRWCRQLTKPLVT